MLISFDEEPVLLCGRDFLLEELDEIIETVEMFPTLSCKELASTICENLNWVTPTGNYKLKSCMSLLEKMQKDGLIKLPAKASHSKGGKEKIVIGPRTEPGSEIIGNISDLDPIELEKVNSKDGRKLWNEYIERYHSLGYKRPFGAHQRYFIRTEGESGLLLGCMLFSAAAWALSSRDEWIGWKEDDRSRRLNLVVNNTRFLIFPWVRVRNLASKALSLVSKRIGRDWQDRYGYQPVLLETFVDKEKYEGTCYKAANWILIGETTGRGRMDRYRKYLSSPKLIYLYPLTNDFRGWLLGEKLNRGQKDEYLLS